MKTRLPQFFLTLFWTAFAMATGVAQPRERPDPVADHRAERSMQGTYEYRRYLQNNVTVEVRNGVATLRGTVPSHDEKSRAEDLARLTPGVSRVESQLYVQPPLTGRLDQAISSDLRSSLLTRPGVFSPDIFVTVQDGIVTLTGKAESEEQKERVASYAREIPGVRSVQNNLLVDVSLAQRRRISSDPTVAELNAARVPQGDAALAALVKAELILNHDTSRLRLEVEAKEGVVVLRGKVASEAERELIGRVASKVEGVKEVKNETVVTKPPAAPPAKN